MSDMLQLVVVLPNSSSSQELLNRMSDMLQLVVEQPNNSSSLKLKLSY